MPANVENLSNDDLLVQLNELCEEVGWRVANFLDATDRHALAEGAVFAQAAERAVECRVDGRICGSLVWTSRKLAERAADARLTRPAEQEAFDGFLNEHPELGDDAS